MFALSAGTVQAAKNIGRMPAPQVESQTEDIVDESELAGHAADALLERLMARFSRTLVELDRAFPEDRQYFITELATLSESGNSEAENALTALRMLDELAAERSSLLGGASDSAVTGLLMARANFIDMIGYLHGTEMCARYVREGSQALADGGATESLAAEYDTKYALAFSAMAGAHDGAPETEEATADDIEGFRAYLLTLGARENQLHLVDDPPEADDAEACSFVVLMLEGAATMPGEAGIRVRWQFGQHLREFL